MAFAIIATINLTRAGNLLFLVRLQCHQFAASRYVRASQLCVPMLVGATTNTRRLLSIRGVDHAAVRVALLPPKRPGLQMHRPSQPAAVVTRASTGPSVKPHATVCARTSPRSWLPSTQFPHGWQHVTLERLPVCGRREGNGHDVAAVDGLVVVAVMRQWVDGLELQDVAAQLQSPDVRVLHVHQDLVALHGMVEVECHLGREKSEVGGGSSGSCGLHALTNKT